MYTEDYFLSIGFSKYYDNKIKQFKEGLLRWVNLIDDCSYLVMLKLEGKEWKIFKLEHEGHKSNLSEKFINMNDLESVIEFVKENTMTTF